MSRFELVIFDCDGVLVDSEMLSASVLMGMMQEEGLPVTTETFQRDFLGRSFASAATRVLERFGRPLPDDFQMRYRARLLAKMEKELKPMAGVKEVLDNMTAPYCLATSSSIERLTVSLAATGLAPYFEGRCFTAAQVKNGKPAPDLFLHAAARMGADPSACLAIEDSEMGIRAAQAAGIAVWHFAGGAHIHAGYRLPNELHPDEVIHGMDQLGKYFSKLGLCRAAPGG
ncbi:HAD family hydrolase [Aestuariivirga sp.]|uniref:HAD family hydrolase n=1 Tax=Aestuariivirga sp. TaxID=2650926 RepID=UPI0039E44360